MPDPGRAARRLAAAALIALALTAAAGVVDNPAPASPRSVTLPEGAPRPAGWGAARLPAGEGADPPDRAGPVLGVVGGRPAGLVRLDPRTLEPLDGRRVVLPSGTSGYAWSPDRRLLVLGDLDDDVVHVVDPVRLRLVTTIRFGIVARAPRQVAWLGPRRLAVVAGDPGDGAYLLTVDPVAGRVLSRRRLAPATLTGVVAGDRLVLLRAAVDGIRAAGLLVVDAHGGVRTLDPEATGARWQAGRLLAFGSIWDGEAQRERGSGLTVYQQGDHLGRHLLGDRAVLDARLRGDLVYAVVDRGGGQPGRVVLSLTTGRVLASSNDPLPDLLLGERDSLC